MKREQKTIQKHLTNLPNTAEDLGILLSGYGGKNYMNMMLMEKMIVWTMKMIVTNKIDRLFNFK